MRSQSSPASREQVGAEEHRRASGPEPGQVTLDEQPCLRIEATHGLVEHEKGFAREEAGRETELLHHALRAVPHRLVERGRREVERRQQLALPIGAGLDAVHLRHELQELVSAEMVRREKSLGQIDEGTARLGRARGLTENLDPARIDVAQVEQALDAGGLARAIDPGQSEDLSGANLEREIGQHRVAADPLAYA